MFKKNTDKSKELIKELQKEYAHVSKNEYLKLRLKHIGMSIITILKGVVALAFLTVLAKLIVWFYNYI